MTMAFLLPVPEVSTPLVLKRSSSSPSLWTLFSVNRPFLYKHQQRRRTESSFPILTTKAVYTQGDLSISSLNTQKLAPKREKMELETDAISILNERIRRDLGKREATRPVMDSREADKYIQLVKEQQQRGLQKLKGDRESKEGGVFSYKVDPYTLRSGDYVVHKKVGIGRFVGIKFDVPKGSTEPIEYVFIEFADGMAKLPVKQASRMLYRYNL